MGGLQYEKITAVIKDKKVTREAVNVDKYKPKEVVSELREYFKLSDEQKFNPSYHHSSLVKKFGIKSQTDDPFDTDSKYCLYDDAHEDHVYTRDWIEFLKEKLKPNPIDKFNEIISST